MQPRSLSKNPDAGHANGAGLKDKITAIGRPATAAGGERRLPAGEEGMQCAARHRCFPQRELEAVVAVGKRETDFASIRRPAEECGGIGSRGELAVFRGITARDVELVVNGVN